MTVENTTFGTITIDGKTYEHHAYSPLRRSSETEEEAVEKVLRQPRTFFRKMKLSLSLRGDTASSLLARAKFTVTID
jgi:hypothetical protein